MPDAIACKRQVAIRRILAPGLVELVKIGLDFGAGCFEHRPNDRPALGALEFWGNSCQTFRPCPAQKFGENCFSLVVERVCRGHRIQFSSRQKLPKPRIAYSTSR